MFGSLSSFLSLNLTLCLIEINQLNCSRLLVYFSLNCSKTGSNFVKFLWNFPIKQAFLRVEALLPFKNVQNTVQGWKWFFLYQVMYNVGPYSYPYILLFTRIMTKLCQTSLLQLRVTWLVDFWVDFSVAMPNVLVMKWNTVSKSFDYFFTNWTSVQLGFSSFISEVA